MAAPMPRVPPVTKATRPLSLSPARALTLSSWLWSRTLMSSPWAGGPGGRARRPTPGAGSRRPAAEVEVVERVQRPAPVPILEQPKIGAGDAVAVAQHDVARDRLEARA